jgi:hypothetical protein
MAYRPQLERGKVPLVCNPFVRILRPEQGSRKFVGCQIDDGVGTLRSLRNVTPLWKSQFFHKTANRQCRDIQTYFCARSIYFVLCDDQLHTIT